MIKIYEYSALNNDEIFDRANPTGDVSAIVADIIEDVKANGDEALFRYCEKFDKASLTSLEVTSEEIREALSDPVSQIIDAIRSTLEKTPPELAADIIDHGIMLTGGGALLRGLDKLIEIETKMPVHIAHNPLDCVVDGTGICLENDALGTLSGEKKKKR